MLLFAGCIGLPATGCHDERPQQLQSQIDVLDTQDDRLRQAVSDQESTLAVMEQRLVSERGHLRDFNAGVEGYLLEHKLAVAALAIGVKGVEVSLGGSNAYSAEAKQWGAALAALAVVYAIAHMDEVTDLTKTLNEADAHLRSLQAGIEQTASSIETQRVVVQRAHENLDRVAQREAALQQQLQTL